MQRERETEREIDGMGGFIHGCRNCKYSLMYNFGGGPRGDPLFTAF